MLRPTHALLLTLPLLASCEGLRPADMGTAPGLASSGRATTPGGPASRGDDSASVDHQRAAIAAIRAGDLDAAEGHLDELRFATELADAEAALAAGSPEDALASVDRALRVRPRSLRALEIKAEGSEQLAANMIARSMGAQFVEGAYLDAYDAYGSLPPSVVNLVGASRAALALDRPGAALELARDARDLAPEEGPERVAAQDAWARAAYRAYTYQLAVEADPAAGEPLVDPLDALFLEADDALNQLAAYAAEDPWTWLSLGDLMLWAGDRDEAALRFAAGLDHHPGDAVLVSRLRGALSARGQAGLVEALAEEAARLPQSAPLGLTLGQERVRLAIPLQASDPATAREAFATAEAELSRTRAMAPELTSDCLTWEVIARAGQGWCDYNAGDLEGATATFLSMEDVFEGGMAWSLGTEVRSGVDGVWFVGDQHRQAGDWEAAAEAFEALSAYQPDDPNWANNAGFFCRDAAVELELLAGALCDAAAGTVSDPELLAQLHRAAGVAEDLAGSDAAPVLLRAAADRALERAWDLAERSLEAYRRAATLAPDDVRIVNDTALVAIYYLHTDLDKAERLLQRAIDMGAEQLAAADEGVLELTDGARAALEEVWGDAYQNMGVLEMLHRKDPVAALPWFERSVEIGPVPRPFLTEALMPWCRGELEVPLARVMPEAHWGAPCGQR